MQHDVAGPVETPHPDPENGDGARQLSSRIDDYPAHPVRRRHVRISAERVGRLRRGWDNNASTDAHAPAPRAPRFTGAASFKAAGEFPDPQSPIRQVVTRHRAWFHADLRAMLTEAGRDDIELKAEALAMLRDSLLTGS